MSETYNPESVAAPWHQLPLASLNHAQLLHLFTACSDVREYLCTPMSEGDFAYATNGHWIVRFPLAGYDGSGGPIREKGEYPKTLASVFERAAEAGTEFLPLRDIPKPKQQCPCCGGNGISDASTCMRCEGFGLLFENALPFQYHGMGFSPVYLYLLSQLPGIEFAPPNMPPQQRYVPPGSPGARFRLPGGIEGCLMPCRPTEGAE